MRRVIVFLASIFISGIMLAQGSRAFEKGYLGNVELNAGFTFDNGVNGALLTSHGYSTGFGLYVGAGTGLIVNTMYYSRFSVPVFADVKYSFLNRPFSPFIALKLGTDVNIEEWNAGLYCSPSVGVDIKRFSVFLKYDCCTGRHSWFSGKEFLDVEYVKHALSVGVSYSF